MTQTQRASKLFFVLMFAFAQTLTPAILYAENVPAPYEKDFVITAYYSPEVSQCCYIRGSFGGDIALNGEGSHGADGTEVFAGMAAAPSSYAFGTAIELPGLGIVSVHDRGGAIHSLDTGSDRLDLWVGSGEEGLARALAFGVRHVHGTVYPLGTVQPKASLNLSSLSAPLETLRAFKSQDPLLLSLDVHKGDRSLSVKLLQEKLQKIGYFSSSLTGVFGTDTQNSLMQFQQDFHLNGEASDTLSPLTAATLSVVAARPVQDPGWLQSDTLSPSTVPSVKRALRLLGYYKGRTTPLADKPLTDALVAFQTQQGIVVSPDDAGAGSFGPKTKKALKRAWLSVIIASESEKILFAYHIHSLVAEKGMIVEDFLGTGDRGEQVKRLQKFLVKNHYLASDKVTGRFGSETEKALIAYQISSKVISDEKDRGAGFAGPATLAQMQHDTEASAMLLVRSEGWEAL